MTFSDVVTLATNSEWYKTVIMGSCACTCTTNNNSSSNASHLQKTYDDLKERTNKTQQPPKPPKTSIQQSKNISPKNITTNPITKYVSSSDHGQINVVARTFSNQLTIVEPGFKEKKSMSVDNSNIKMKTIMVGANDCFSDSTLLHQVRLDIENDSITFERLGVNEADLCYAGVRNPRTRIKYVLLYKKSMNQIILIVPSHTQSTFGFGQIQLRYVSKFN